MNLQDAIRKTLGLKSTSPSSSAEAPPAASVPAMPEQPVLQPWEIPHHPTASKEDIFYCFRLILGRSPNPEEWQGHSGHAGADLDTVLNVYLGSLEFAQRAAKLSSQKFDDRLTLENLGDFSIYVQQGDLAVGQVIQHHRVYEAHVSRIFRERLKPGMHVLDVGANIGYFSLLAAALVGSTGSVIAIEPNAVNTRMLEASRRANAYDNVVIHQAAAGTRPGLLVLNTAYSNGTTAGLPEDVASLMNAVTVPCMPIDQLVPADLHVSLIKIDVEGAEYNALLGARALIERCHPLIVSEFSPDMMPMISQVDGPAYLALLISFGYRISVIEQDGSLTACGTDIAMIMAAYLRSGVDHIDLLME